MVDAIWSLCHLAIVHPTANAVVPTWAAPSTSKGLDFLSSWILLRHAARPDDRLTFFLDRIGVFTTARSRPGRTPDGISTPRATCTWCGRRRRRERRHDTLAHRGKATGLTGSPALDAVWYGAEGAALGLGSQTTAPPFEGVFFLWGGPGCGARAQC